MNEPQKTPLTDVALTYIREYALDGTAEYIPYVRPDFARALERRHAALREALEVIEYTSRSTTSSRRILRDLIQAALKADDEARK